jgi:hypothetical protein
MEPKKKTEEEEDNPNDLHLLEMQHWYCVILGSHGIRLIYVGFES